MNTLDKLETTAIKEFKLLYPTGLTDTEQDFEQWAANHPKYYILFK